MRTSGVQAGLSARRRRWLCSATVGLGLRLGQMTVMMAFMSLIAVAQSVEDEIERNGNHASNHNTRMQDGLRPVRQLLEQIGDMIGMKAIASVSATIRILY